MAYEWRDFNAALKFTETPYAESKDKVIDPRYPPLQRQRILIMDLCAHMSSAKANHYYSHYACRPDNDTHLRNMLKFLFMT